MTPQSLWIFGILAIVVAALKWFFDRTRLGKAMLATSHNRLAAQLVGIDVRTTLLVSFGVAAALGALAGVLTAPITLTRYDVGIMLGLKGFAAAILGGIGNPFGAVAGGLTLGIAEAIRIVEEAQPFLDPEDMPNSAVEQRSKAGIAANLVGQRFDERAAHHVHVDAGAQRQGRRLGARFGYAVIHQFGDSVPVAHDKAVEAPGVSQHVAHETAVRSSRGAGDVVEGGHDGARASAHRRVERREVDLVQRTLAQVGAVIVAAGIAAVETANGQASVAQQFLVEAIRRDAQIGPVEIGFA